MEVLNHLIAFFEVYGYIAVFLVLIACGFGLPIPEDITLIAGGVICGLALHANNIQHAADVQIMVLVALVGVLLGDSTMFMLGRILGSKVKRIPILKNIFTDNNYQIIQKKAQKYGLKILFIARFLPGLRAPIFLTAGISHRVPLWKFLFMDGLAAIISVPLWVYAGYYFAAELDDLLIWVKKSEVIIFSIIGVILVIFIIYKLKHSKK